MTAMFRQITARSFLARSAISTTRQTRSFHQCFPKFINAGETIPNTTVFEDSPGNKLSLTDAFNGKKSVIIGVPGAFSPACSASHVPGYLSNWQQFVGKGYSNLFVVAVNDPFVTKAWKDSLGAPEDVHFISDATGELTEQLEFSFDASGFFGNERSKRYALLVDAEGKVENLFVEPDNVSVNVSSADNVLKHA